MLRKRKKNNPNFIFPIFGKKPSGQGLTEYLIIVSLIAIGTIGIVRIMGQTLSAQFTDVTHALRGEHTRKTEKAEIRESHYKLKDLGNFLDGSSSREQKSDK